MRRCSKFVYYRAQPAETFPCSVCQSQFPQKHLFALTCGHLTCLNCTRQNLPEETICPVCGSVSRNLALGGNAKPKAGADTNVFEVFFRDLQEGVGEENRHFPVFCRNCNAILTAFSQISSENGEQFWVCEYCTYRNVVEIEQSAIPQRDEMAYLIDPEPAQRPEVEVLGDDDISVIFCIDTSGSMGQIIHTEMIGSETKAISRLDCVRMAVASQVEEMLKSTPSRHIGLVDFGSTVTLYGDKLNHFQPAVDMEDFDSIANAMAEMHSKMLSRPVSKVETQLLSQLRNLKAKGSTALGPALLMSISLARQGRPGSKVIICTDGEANIGIGSIDITTEARRRKTEETYERIGQYAQRSGTSVSIISIAEAQSRLSYLSTVADLTEGSVLKVDPRNLTADFSTILSEKTIATEVKAVVTMHKALKFKNENPDNISQGGSQLTREIGNVTQISSFTFEYEVKNAEELAVAEVDMSRITQLPLQLTVQYRNLRGLRCIRSYAKVQQISTDQREAEQGADFEVLSRNYKLQNARKVAEGKFEALKEEDEEYQQVLERNARSEEQLEAARRVNTEMDSLKEAVLRQEVEESFRNLSEAERQSQRKAMMKDEVTVQLNRLRKGK